MNDDATGDLAGMVEAASAEATFEEILNRLPHGVLVVSREQVVKFVNREARRLLGDPAGLAPGEALPELVPEFSMTALAESLFTNEPDTNRHLIARDDRTFCIEGLPAHGDRAIFSIEDVTEREQRRMTERHFIENAAHELRTPLAAIISVIEVLESGAKDNPEVRDRFLVHLREHSERLRRLATSLLILARIQTGQRAQHVELVHVRPLLAQIADDLVVRPGVEVSLEAEANLATLADEELLYRALTNIAENAAKYTATGTIELEGRRRGNRTEIEIRDTGRGMSPEDREHAFDRFYRAENHGDGFGLGLAIADEAIQALHGTLKLDSAPGAGTRVSIALPNAELVE